MNTFLASDRWQRRTTQRLAVRRGTMLLEVTVAAIILGALLVVLNQAIVRLHRQATLVDAQITAQQALNNLMEELVARQWDSIDSEAIDSLSLPDAMLERLPNAELSGKVVEETEPVTAKRITLVLRWRAASGSNMKELRLTSWVYKREEEAP